MGGGLTFAAMALLLAPSVKAAEAEASASNPMPSRLANFALQVDPGVAVPLTQSQSQIFTTGASETIKAFWPVLEYLEVGPSLTFLVLPARQPASDSGTAWSLGGSLRVRHAFDIPYTYTHHVVSPWIDVDALYVRTGSLDRFGFAAAVGAAVTIGESRIFWVGPFVRYFQIVQLDDTGHDTRDARILSVGISLEVWPNFERKRETANEGSK